MNGDGHVGAAGPLFRDAILTFLLLNEGRHRVVAWMFGNPREDSNRVTVIALGALADGANDKAMRVLAAGALPSLAATTVAAAAVRETARGIAGESSRTTPLFGTLIAVAVLGKWFGPAVRASLHGVRATIHSFRMASRRFMALLGGEG